MHDEESQRILAALRANSVHMHRLLDYLKAGKFAG